MIAGFSTNERGNVILSVGGDEAIEIDFGSQELLELADFIRKLAEIRAASEAAQDSAEVLKDRLLAAFGTGGAIGHA